MSGETALARQLKKLAVPQTTVLIQDKIRKSFLFDHRDAAGLDRDLIFSYGTNGLEKLCNINPLFSKFQSNLFSLSYKEFERSVQSKDVNKKLDEKISEFLKMLSPYFLIRAAHEALEWLIYRFHIHMFNVDDLVASVLPHYNTSTFVRVVQLLDLDDGSRWFWLKPVQKSGVHLDYSAILNRFVSDSGFMKFVCDIAPNVLSIYKSNTNVAIPIISFSMITIYNALVKCQLVEDKFITMLFPYILKGLASDLSKYTALSYLIISQIVLKIKLTPKVTEELLVRVFQAVKEDLTQEAFQLLLLVFQNQSIKSLPKKVQFVILSNHESLNILSNLDDDYETFSLLKGILKKSISALFMTPGFNAKKCRKAMNFFNKFLNSVKLDEKLVFLCFNMTLKKVTKYLQDKSLKRYQKHFNKNAKSVLKCLENKYPDHFDKAYRNFLEEKQKFNKSVLCKLINNSVCSVKYKLLPSNKTSLVIGLNHAINEIRLTSVSYLLELITENNFSDKEFLENSLYDRLLDKSSNVVNIILLHPNIILSILGHTKTISAFENIFKRNIKLKSDWYPIIMKCLHIITEYFQSKEHSVDILSMILQFILPVNKHTIEGFLFLLNSDVDNFLVQELKNLKLDISEKECINDEKYFEINCMIVKCIKNCAMKMDQESKLTVVSFMNSKISVYGSNSFLSFYMYFMQFVIIEETSDNIVQHTQDLLQVLRYYFLQSNIVLEKLDDMSEENVIKKSLDSLNKNRFPSSLIFYTFRTVVSYIKINLDSKLWPDIKAQDYRILTNLFDFCIINLNSDKGVLKEYFQTMLSLLISHQLRNIQNTYKFLCTKWTNYDGDTSFIIQIMSISISATFSKEQRNKEWLFDNNLVFLCLLKAIADPNTHVRHAALNLLSLSLVSRKNITHPLKYLAEKICANSEEIKMDYRQCYDCVGHWLNPAIDCIDIKNTVTKDQQNKKLILELFLNLLTQEEVPYSIKHFLVLCLQNVDSVVVLSAYIPVLNTLLTLLEKSEAEKELVLSMIEILLKKFNVKTVACLTENSNESKALLHCLKFVTEDGTAVDSLVQTLTLNILSKEFFSCIPSIKVQQDIFNILLEFYMISPTSINIKVGKVLQKLCTYAYLFLKHFQDKELSVSKSTTLREAKKIRIGEKTDHFTTFENGAWKKMTVFLEIMQNKSKLLKNDVLVSELFNLLNKTLDFDSQAPVEYVRQLILSTIYSCCKQLGSERLDERQFQVELIVQCIRSSTNAKTHHQALLLLNLAAAMFPDYVLNNVMSIFTFMGSSLVRQDDSYSFQVISQTIETIVPSLLEASNQQTETDGVQVVASVIRVFVDSLSDIPAHRQLPLFTKLISTLDPSKYLWIPLGQICDQYATLFHDITTDDSNNWKISPTLEFAVNLHKQFSPDIQINTCLKLAQFLAMLPDTKQQLDANPGIYEKIKEPFNIINHNDKQLQIYKHNMLSYMKIWLSSQAFLSQVSELSIKEQCNLEEKYELLLESVLSLIQDRLSTKHSKKFTRNLNNQVQLLYDLLYAINSLLPCNMFMRVIRHLLKHNEKEIQVKAIELLNTKLEQQQDLGNKESHKALKKLLRPLLKLVNKCISEKSTDSKLAVIQQTALYTLHLLSKLIGSVYPTKFYKVLNVTVIILSRYTQPELTVNALLCLAQLCNCLNVDILPHLNSFMPVLVNILQDEKILNMSECLILGVIAALQSIIENLGMFLSSYMEAIITGICKFSVQYSELEKKFISEKFENLQSKLASEIALRVLLTAIESSYFKLSSKNANIIVPLIKILTEKLNSSSYEDILSSVPQLQKFYLSLLDFRNSNQHLDIETTAQVENSIIFSFETFVMKLSVTRFRTFFQKIYQWATTTNEDQEQKYRIYTFYKLTCEFSKSLKSLFTHMAKYFFRHIAFVIESNNIFKSNTSYFKDNATLSHELLVNVIDTLNCCFMHAEDQFLDKENFEVLMQPLVDQIENLNNETLYQELIENHLSSCIAHFMTAVSDTSLWKALNYQVLLKTRHDSPKVRFGSLQVILEVVNKMGDNYLVLLPESIPFLAEIMEDESTEVEQECQTVIIEMEKILGEPIRKYF